MKKNFSTIILALVTAIVSAAPINQEQARRIATVFFAGGTRVGAASVELSWAGSSLEKGIMRHSSPTDTENALLYIYNRSDAPGFVIISGDDNERPIIAFSHERSFDMENVADGARNLLSAWCEQIASARAGQSTSPRQLQTTSVGSIVCKYSTALWSQSEPFNREAPVYNGYRSITGCVATAMSIIAYYHKWPEQGIGTTPSYVHNDEWNTQRTVPENTLGRKYDYANMLLDYNSGYTSTQGNAVAALMYDMGTSVMMSYSPSFSGARSNEVPIALSKYFGYSKGALLVSRGAKSDNEWFSMLKENISTYGPTYFSGNDTQGGHAFILDGYTTGDYFHINYGWGGYSNGYYWLPEIEYFNGQDAVFYLEPDKDGSSTYRDNISLCSLSNGTYNYCGLYSMATEYKTNQTFRLLLGGVCNFGTTTYNGDIQVVHCDKNGEVKSNIVTSNISSLQERYMLYYNPIDARILSTIEEGDRLRVYYKGAYSSDWQWARAVDKDCFDEILLKATPEEVAKSLTFGYTKSQKIFTYISPNAIQYTVKRVADSSIVASGATASRTSAQIDASSFESGEYIFEFASGGEPYVLRVVL